MIVGFTGTRFGMTDAQHQAVLLWLIEAHPTEAHHGDCMGADEQFHDIVRRRWKNCRVVVHPPQDKRLVAWCDGDDTRPARPFLKRNRVIVDETEILLAAPFETEEQPRGGTWSTVRYAQLRGKPVTVVLPDGSVDGPKLREDIYKPPTR